MDSIKHKNLKNFNLNQEKELFTNVEPVFYSFDINVFVMIKNLKPYEKSAIKNMFLEYYSNLKNIEDIDNVCTSDDELILLDNLISNMLHLSRNKNMPNSIQTKYGIYVIMHHMNKYKRKDLKLLKSILFFNNEVKTYSNKKLLRIYNKTYKDYTSTLLMIENKDIYKKYFNNNIILEIKRADVISEFKRRCNIAKICEIVNENGTPQGDGYFIPRFNLDDDIIIFFKNVPYTLSGFKKSKLSTKKINGKICWK